MLHGHSDLRIDIESLSFHLDSLDPNLPLRLSVEQDGFYQTMRAILMRAQYSSDQSLPAELSLRSLPRPFTHKDAQEMIGALVFDLALNMPRP